MAKLKESREVKAAKDACCQYFRKTGKACGYCPIYRAGKCSYTDRVSTMQKVLQGNLQQC